MRLTLRDSIALHRWSQVRWVFDSARVCTHQIFHRLQLALAQKMHDKCYEKIHLNQRIGTFKTEEMGICSVNHARITVRSSLKAATITVSLPGSSLGTYTPCTKNLTDSPKCPCNRVIECPAVSEEAQRGYRVKCYIPDTPCVYIYT